METNWLMIAVSAVLAVTGGFSLALRICHRRQQSRERWRSQISQRLQEVCKPVQITGG